MNDNTPPEYVTAIHPGGLAYLALDGITHHRPDGANWSPTTMDARELAMLRVSLVQALAKIEDTLAARGLIDRVTTPRSAPPDKVSVR